MEIIIASAIVIALVILPVFLWPGSRRLAIPAAVLSIAFFLINREFVCGKAGVWHDNLQNFQVFFSLWNQWMDSGVELGWNPYLWGGQPMAILNNYLLWAPMILLTKLFQFLHLGLSPIVLFNLGWLLINFILFTGTLLFLQRCYKNSYVSLLGFSTLIFSNFFHANLGEPTGVWTLYLIPYMLFFALSTSRIGLPAFFFLLGVSFNSYIPIYTCLALAVFFCFTSLTFPQETFSRIKELTKRPWTHFLSCLLIFLAVAGPFFYSYHEIGDYVSPRRGFYQRGIAPSSAAELTPAKESNLSSYLRLFDRENSQENMEWMHGAFYIGIIPGILLLFALFSPIGRIFLATAAVLAAFSLGHKTVFWNWIQHIPLLKITRQTFIFSQISGFFILLGALAGLSLILTKARRPKMIAAIAAIIMVFHLFDMGSFAAAAAKKMRSASLHALKKITYPLTWKTVKEKEDRSIAFDQRPMINKESVWTTRDPDYMLFVQKDFAGFVQKHKFSEKPPATGDIFRLLASPDNLRDLAGRIEIKPSRDPNRISMTVDARQDAYLLRMENFHRNWRVFIDGKKGGIEKTDPNFQIVRIPSGKHEVTFAFRSAYQPLVNLHILAVVCAWLAMLWALRKEKA